MAGRWTQGWILRDIGDGSTAVGRSWGHDRPTLLDVMQYLADSKRSAGAALAAAGLTEQTIALWRREQSGAQMPPVLDVRRVDVLPEVDQLLQQVQDDPTPLLDKGVGLSRVGAELLAESRADDPSLSALLETFGIDRHRLAQRLTESAAHTRWLAHPGLIIMERLGTIVFVPLLTEPGELSHALPGRATWVDPDATAPAIGEKVLACLAAQGSTAEPESEPYWTRLGYKTASAFDRRSRQVSVTQLDYSLHLHCRRHSGRLRHEGLADSTGIHTPINDPGAVGNAVLAAINASMG